jgi:Trk K+ transport system NAD-binding subunit
MDIKWPEGVLVAMINRNDHIFIPRGQTKLNAHDRLTLIGEERGITRAREQFLEARSV